MATDNPGAAAPWPPARAAVEVRVGTLTARAAAVRRGRVWVAGLPPDLMPDLVMVGGARPGPVLAVVAGIHGDEAAGVEAVLEIAAGVDPGELAGTLLLVPVANVAAFREHRPYVNPLDGQDLERLFPGRARGGPSVRLAHAVCEQVVTAADAVVDLHGGGLVERVAPFTLVPSLASDAAVVPGGSDGAPVHARTMRMARAFGLPHLVESPLPGSLVEAAAVMGRPALRATAGSHGRAVRGAVRVLVDGVGAVMAALDMAPGRSAAAPGAVEAGGWRWLLAPADGYWRPTAAVPGRVAAGRLIGTVTPRGEGAAERVAVRAPIDGELLVLVDHLATRRLAPLAAMWAADGAG